VIRDVVANPVQVVLAECGAGDDAKPVLRQTGDGEVAFDAAAVVEHLGVGESPDRARDAIVREALQELRRAATADLDLGEGSEIKHRGRLAARSMLSLDRGRPQPAGPTPRPQRLVTAGGVRLEPVGPLPARFLAKRGAELLEAGVSRRQAKRPARAALVTRELD